jgi:Patatin-like phospholipase
MPLRTPARNTFELGLVMAGAASAGAYTAGVIDFLFEALQAWEAAKARADPGVPDHGVQIRVAAGASAGGIVAALLAMLPFAGHHPMRDLADTATPADAENAQRNLLYKCWVTDVDIRRMLATDDLATGGSGIPSLLNGNVLADVANDAIAGVRANLASPNVAQPPTYLANPLQLYLCLTNMRGLPYIVSMVADEKMRGHRVKSHADYGHFAVFGAGPGEPDAYVRGAIPVNWPGTVGVPDADGWDRLRDAALATSAFPGGFPARPFRNPISTYRTRPDIGMAAIEGASVRLCLDLPNALDDAYDFWCVDGGLLDNEPLEFARAALLGSADGHAPRDARCADRAVLLIDPFPNDIEIPSPPFDSGPDLLDSLFSLIPILRQHAAFKPRDLLLALQEDVRSRFLIAPMREEARGGEGDLACAGLAGFAGFVHQRLRLHDFQLGRRNCQKFLRDRFSVHISNPLVSGWVERLGREPGLLDLYHPATQHGTVDRDMVQIIPLLDAARMEVAPIPWPKLDQRIDFDPVKRLINRRADAIVPGIVRRLLVRLGVDDHHLVNRAVQAIACDVITSRAGRSASLSVERDLRRRNLM